MKKLVACVVGLCLAGCLPSGEQKAKQEPEEVRQGTSKQEEPKVEQPKQVARKRPARKEKPHPVPPVVYAHDLKEMAHFKHQDFVNRYFNREITVVGKVDIAHRSYLGTFFHLHDKDFRKGIDSVSCRFEGKAGEEVMPGDWVAITGKCQNYKNYDTVKVESCTRVVKVEEPADFNQMVKIPD